MNWKQRKQEQKRLAREVLNKPKESIGGTIYRNGQIRLSDLVPTSEDWAPSYPNGYLEASLTLNHGAGNNNKIDGQVWHRVAVWGADDFGMNKDFVGEDSSQQAIKCYHAVLQLKNVTRDGLFSLGFEYF